MSEQSTDNGIVNYETAFYGQGEAPWARVKLKFGDAMKYFRILTLEGNEEQAQEYYYGMSQIVRYPDCGDAYIASYGNDQYGILVPEDAYEAQIQPRIRQLEQGITPIRFGRPVSNDPAAILENRVRGLLFENGERGWKFINDNHGGCYRRSIAPSQLQIGGGRYDFFNEVLPRAQEMMREQLGIESLGGFSTTGNSAVFTIPTEDFHRLRATLGKFDAGKLASRNENVSHLDRLSERRKIEDMAKYQGGK